MSSCITASFGFDIDFIFRRLKEDNVKIPIYMKVTDKICCIFSRVDTLDLILSL